MQTLDKLRAIVTERMRPEYDFSLQYYRKGEDTDSQIIDTAGYYLAIWPKEPTSAPKPGDWNFAEYSDGEFIGSSFTEAKLWIEAELTPEKVAQWQAHQQ